MRARSFLFVGVPVAIALTLSSCGGGAPAEEQPSAASTQTTASRPAPTPTATASPTAAVEPVEAGELVQPGAEPALGEWFTYEWQNSDGKKAVLQSRFLGLERVDETTMAGIIAENPDMQGYSMTLVRWETRKVSGDDITYSSNITEFQPISADLTRSNTAMAWGGGMCDAESFTAEFEQGAAISGCKIGLEVTGGKTVDGLMWTGPSALTYSDEGPNIYDTKDGTPVYMWP